MDEEQYSDAIRFFTDPVAVTAGDVSYLKPGKLYFVAYSCVSSLSRSLTPKLIG